MFQGTICSLRLSYNLSMGEYAFFWLLYFSFVIVFAQDIDSPVLVVQNDQGKEVPLKITQVEVKTEIVGFLAID